MSTDAPATAPGRDVFLDFLRNVSLLSVVFCHYFFALNLWNARAGTFQAHGIQAEGWGWLSYVFVWQMPAFFFVGGALAFRSALGRDLRRFYVRRLWRLLMPVVALLVVLWGANALLGFFDPPTCTRDPGARIGLGCTSLLPVRHLWFLALYIPMLGVSPLLARVWSRRFGPLLVPIVVAVVVASDAVRYLGHPRPVLHGLAGTGAWILCWLLGFAYAQGRLQRIPRRRLIATCAAALVFHVAGTTVGPYDPNLNGMWPNLLNVAGSLFGIGVALLLRDRIVAWCRDARAGRWVSGPLSQRLMTVYVWSASTQILVYAGLLVVGFPLQDHPSWAWLAQRPLLVLAPVPVLILCVRLFGWVEDLPVPDRLAGRSALSRAPANS